MSKLKKGDSVIVIAGKDKGRKGIIKSVLIGSSKVVIDGINIAKKHVKANPNKGIEGGISEKAMPLHISNVAMLNPSTNKASRLGYRMTEEGSKKVRFFKSNNELVEI